MQPTLLAPAPLIAGAVVDGRFELERLAGQGGMGAVWRARDGATGERVAVKVMQRAAAAHFERFTREAELLAHLRHPRVVRYVTHGVTDDGQHYLAMEWLDGEDLAQRLAREALSVEESVRVVTLAAEALAVAHARGVVHRDIKPSNLYLPGGRIDDLKVLDFGIARLHLAPQGMTRTGTTLGTPGYMAPEQARGERDVDARADVFALGCVLFECLAGRPPFVGEHLMAILAKVLLEDAARVRELRRDAPAALDDLVARMLDKQPANRPADAGAVARALAELGALPAEPPRAKTPTGGQALTSGEQRLLSLVIASAPPASETAVTNVFAGATAVPVADADVATKLAAFGTIETLADGSVVAIVTGQRVATDQAAHAARCALALRALRPRVAMALATGRGAVSARLPVGEVIDRATRLVMLSTGGDGGPSTSEAIRLDEVTAGLLDQRFELGGDSRGLVLAGEREAVDTTRTLLGKPTPIVGRERELGMLDGVFAESVAESVARTVVVTAPPGAGKSRLISELVRRLRASASGAEPEVWIGRGDPLTAGSPLAILAQAVRRACGLLDGEPAAVRRHKLRARVARHVPAADRDRVGEFLAELLGCEDPDRASEPLRAARGNPVLMGDQLRRAWEDFVAAEAAHGPVVLVVEDLQWADPPTTKFVAAALRRARDLPLLVVATGRPEVDELFPALWADHQASRLVLGDLSAKACERLIRQVLGDRVDAARCRALVQRASGNAFYLEELIRAVAEGHDDTLPPTVLAMVQARLDALPPELRRTLRAASVFGQVAWAGGVGALCGGDRAAAHAALGELADRELLERRADTRFSGEDEYGFRHATVRDAAYSLLTDDDRALGHRLAGAWLEARGEPDALVLAEHFDAGGEPARAAPWYAQAAEAALDANDLAGACALAERGIRCGVDGPARGALRVVQLKGTYWQGDCVAAAALGAEARALLDHGTPAWCDACGALGPVYLALGQIDELAIAARELEAAGLPDLDERRLTAWAAIALRLLYAGNYAHADHMLASLAGLADRAGIAPNARGGVCRVFAHRAQIAGDLLEARRLSQASVESYRAAGNDRDAHYELIGVVSVQSEFGEYAEIEATLRELIAIGDAQGNSVLAMVGRLNLGIALGYLGTPDAEDVARRSLAELIAAGDQRLALAARFYLTRVLTLAGRVADALVEGEAAHAALRDQADPTNSCVARAAYAEALILAGRAPEALPIAREAVKILDRLGQIDEGEPFVRLVLVEALLAAGHVEPGRLALASAYAALLRRAEKVSDPAWRDRFFRLVPEHARTVELAREHGLA
jgi:hypothetical protein